MKTAKMTYGEFNKIFGGLRRVLYSRKDYKYKLPATGLLVMYEEVSVIYNPKRGCTYVAISPIGWLDMFGVLDNDETLILRLDGKLTIDELSERKEFQAAVEEVELRWREKMDEDKEES